MSGNQFTVKNVRLLGINVPINKDLEYSKRSNLEEEDNQKILLMNEELKEMWQ